MSTRIIYARPNPNTSGSGGAGSDVTGDGSLAFPYRTTQRALRDVPHVIPPGQRVIVDNSYVLVEPLPADFEFPVIKNSHAFELSFSPFGDPSFFVDTGFSVRAYPQPVAAIAADAFFTAADLVGGTFSVDLDTNLITFKLIAPRGTWTNLNLKGKFIQGPFLPIVTSATIWNVSGNDTLELAANGGDSVANFVFLGAATILEQSATLQGSSVATAQAINIGDCSTFGLNGQKIVNLTADSAALALNLQGCLGNTFFEQCDIEGLGGRVEANPVLLGNYIHGKNFDYTGPGMLSIGVFFEAIPSFPGMGDFPTNWAISGCVFKACPALGARTDPNVISTGAFSVAGRMGLIVHNSWIMNPVTDATDGTPPDGVRATGGLTGLNFVRISGAGRNGIYAADGLGNVELNHVTGGTGVGLDTPNTGFGVYVNDGMQVRVRDDATLIEGLAGHMKVGVLSPRTWVNFRGFVPFKNQYDLEVPFELNVASVETTPAGGVVIGVDEGGNSGSRLYQRLL